MNGRTIQCVLSTAVPANTIALLLLATLLVLGAQVLGQTQEQRWNELNRAVVEAYQRGDYQDGVGAAEDALDLARGAFGAHDPKTLTSLNNLAGLYQSQGRYGEAEPLFEQALALSREVLGPRHPDTLGSLNNLAGLYYFQGRYGEAEPLFEQALALRRDVLGPRHPDTLGTQLNAVANRAARDDPGAAVRLLAEMEGPLLTWLGAEFYSTESTAVRRAMVASQATYQHVALSLAVRHPDLPAAQRLAASALLRFKGLQAEEEAYLARLVRRGRDAEVGRLALEIRDLRDQLARAYHSGIAPEAMAEQTRVLDARERELGRLSRDYRAQLKVREASVGDLQGALSGGRVLVEFRRYGRFGFLEGTFVADHWAAVVVQGYDRIQVVDLGPVSETLRWVAALVAENETADAAAQALYARLIAPLELDPDATVFLAPDDALNLVPFHRLMPDAGSHWTERQALRVVQSGRDLLRPPHDRPGRGLLVLGGIDFDARPTQLAARSDVVEADAVVASERRDAEVSRNRAAAVFRGGFEPLPGSMAELSTVAALYRDARPQESVVRWSATDAAEDRLMSHAPPPRVLHLATHGFYRAPEGRTDRPMLLAGIALAGANQALRAEGEDGILYALEAQDLNLEATELVVLSACETAQGVIGQGEGVYGLVRALRTAGARHVLVTLRPIGDQSTADFMKVFYDKWLDPPTGRSDPAQALQETQRRYLKTNPDADWKPFIVVGAS